MSTTKITDYIKLSKEDRQKHIDLSTECQFHYFERDWNCRGIIKKTGDLYNKAEQMAQAKSALLGFLNIEDFGGSKIHLCHLCNCNSNTDKVCVNPLHLYFGTASENQFDKPFEVRQKCGKIGGKIGAKIMNEKLTKEQRSKGAKIGGKKCAELGITGCQQKAKCYYCDKEGSLAIMHRWHFDNCKHKPISEILQNISNLTPETVSTNLE